MADDKPKDECGVLGVYAPDQEAGRIAFFALHALQHRGQESAGIAVSDGARVRMHKDMGLVSQVFKEDDWPPWLDIWQLGTPATAPRGRVCFAMRSRCSARVWWARSRWPTTAT